MGLPEESQSARHGHGVPSEKPPSQVDVSGQPQSSQHTQQTLEEYASLMNKPSRSTNASTNEGRQEPPVSGIGASLLGSPGGLSNWEYFGEALHNDIDDEPKISSDRARLSNPAAKDTLEHTPQSEYPQDRASFTPEDHPLLLKHGPTSSIPAPLQLHQRTSYSNIAARSLQSPNQAYPLPTPPLSGEPIELSSGGTESVVSLEGLSSGNESNQNINRVINAWSQPAPGISSEAQHEAGVSGTSFVINDGGLSNNGQSSDQGATQPSTDIQKANLGSEQPSVQSDHRPSEPVSEHFVVDGGISAPNSDKTGPTNLNNAKGASADRELDDAQEMTEQELGLDPWYKESLARYTSMLRKESQATSKEEKLKVFTEFLVLECQQRGIPYDPTYEAESDTNKEVRSLDNEVPSQGNSEGLLSIKSEEATLAPGVLSIQTHLQPETQVQDSDDEQYSPGGRPLLRPLYMKQDIDLKKNSETDLHATKDKDSAPENPSETTVLPKPDSPARNAPIVIESAFTSLDRPQAERLDSSISKVSTDTGSQLSWYDPPQNSQQTIKSTSQDYKPYSPLFQTTSKACNEESMPSIPHDSSSTSTRKPCYTPYVSQEQLGGGAVSFNIPQSPQDSVRHSRYLSNASKESAVVSRVTQQDETFLTKVKPGKTTESFTVPSRFEVGSSLKMVLPRDRQLARRQSEYVATIRAAMNNIPDDFTFFDRLHRDWEVEANIVRQKLDEQRQKRQEEQEAHTDQLFAEQQIGYADIKPMEEEFKRSESARKIKEDEEEFQDYTQKVFDPIYTKLQEHIKVLMEQYMSCTNVLKTAVGGRGLLDQHNNRPNLALVMDLLLELYTRIEVRHVRVLSAILERDRRYKKTVLQPLYAAGDVAEMKESEKHFEEAEKKTTYEAAVKKEERTKALVHVIEESTTKVLAEDLEYIKLIAGEVKRVSDDLSPSYRLEDSDGASDLRKDFALARKVLQTLANVDLAIMRHSHTAALILNLAKYDVANASAKLANPDSEELAKLRDQKLKDEYQLGESLQQRIRTVEQDVRKAVEVIDEVLRRLGPVNQSGRKRSSDPVNLADQARLPSEAAKRRNSDQALSSSEPV